MNRRRMKKNFFSHRRLWELVCVLERRSDQYPCRSSQTCTLFVTKQPVQLPLHLPLCSLSLHAIDFRQGLSQRPRCQRDPFRAGLARIESVVRHLHLICQLSCVLEHRQQTNDVQTACKMILLPPYKNPLLFRPFVPWNPTLSQRSRTAHNCWTVPDIGVGPFWPAWPRFLFHRFNNGWKISNSFDLLMLG